jgi:hypothetical protein
MTEGSGAVKAPEPHLEIQPSTGRAGVRKRSS